MVGGAVPLNTTMDTGVCIAEKKQYTKFKHNTKMQIIAEQTVFNKFLFVLYFLYCPAVCYCYM